MRLSCYRERRWLGTRLGNGDDDSANVATVASSRSAGAFRGGDQRWLCRRRRHACELLDDGGIGGVFNFAYGCDLAVNEDEIGDLIEVVLRIDDPPVFDDGFAGHGA